MHSVNYELKQHNRQNWKDKKNYHNTFFDHASNLLIHWLRLSVVNTQKIVFHLDVSCMLEPLQSLSHSWLNG